MFSTGPRTTEGKAASAANGKMRRQPPSSQRGLEEELAEARSLALTLAQLRQALLEQVSGITTP